jgi:hypothetical protein
MVEIPLERGGDRLSKQTWAISLGWRTFRRVSEHYPSVESVRERIEPGFLVTFGDSFDLAENIVETPCKLMANCALNRIRFLTCGESSLGSKVKSLSVRYSHATAWEDGLLC